MLVLLEIFAVAVAALLVGRLVAQPWRGRSLNVLKAWVTVRAFWLLLAHPVTMEDGNRVVAGRLVMNTLGDLDAATFWTFVLLASVTKFAGILASMYRWRLLLVGQAIVLPFRHIFGSFLIGRFIGTFLPSTAGLDGYKLYDAARFSGRTVEVTATTALEKVIGFSGIFLSFLVALPFGIKIFGENAGVIAAITVPVCTGLIASLMLVLWYPALIQWVLFRIPIPGKARLEGLILRVSHSAAAYRGKMGLVLQAFALSFIVHFSTAAMYYFTALAISATGAEFWPIAFGSSIQILATVLSPFTIAGEGIREAAQLVLLGNMIGPDKAIVSAALGFWAAEALTLAGGFFWWARKSDYAPAYCLVDGEQVDYEKAAAESVLLETEEERSQREAEPQQALPPVGVRLALSGSAGMSAGILGGLLIGVVESGVIAAGGLGSEAQALWFGPLAYALVLGGLGLLGGSLLIVLPIGREEIRRWTPPLALIGTAVPMALAITIFRVRRDVFLEQMPPLPVLLGILAGAGVVALVLFILGPRFFASRAGAIARPLPALIALVTVVGGGAVVGRALVVEVPEPPTPQVAPAALRDRPNVILVMVDTLRADHLSCYGATNVKTPELCSLADGGTLYSGFSHASWTKPATASLVSSLLPSSHGAVSKPSALSQETVLVSEVLAEHGYSTGGIVSNINLAQSFGFDQGFDEYHYLAPDYIAGAEESSSKLILYQIARSVWFKLKPGLRVGDFYQDSGTVNELAFDFLDRHRDARFFLFLHYMDPHDPYFEHPYDGYAIARVSNQHPDPELAQEMERLYQGEIEHLDANFGKLLDKLRDLGLYDDTLIALVADHGEEFYEHDGWWHGLTLYDELIHVPFIIKWARGLPAPGGDERRHVARIIDVVPTLITRAGAEVPDAMQGVDVAGGLSRRAEKDRMAFAEEDHEGNVLRAIRTTEWKLIEANEGNPRGLETVELYHVSKDAGETRNLIDDHAEIGGELRAHAEANEKAALAASIGGGESTELSTAEEDALRALGYLE